MDSPTPEEINTELFNAIIANQQNLHDDIMTVFERLKAIEETLSCIEIPEKEDLDDEELYLQARQLVVEMGVCTTSLLQRIFRIGYGRSAMTIDLLEKNKVVGPYRKSKQRKILITPEELEVIEENETRNSEIEDEDELYEQAKECAIEAGKVSTSFLQRKLIIGYSRATQLMDMLETRGVIAPIDKLKPRVVITPRKD